MAALKDVKAKIGAIKKTKQITRAMNMVAASRLRGAQANMEAFRPYASKFAEVLGSLSERSTQEAHPLLVPREQVKKTHVVLCSSDRGLCGGFNANLIAKAEAFIKQRSIGSGDISFTAFGKKGRDWCRKNHFEIVSEHLGVVGARFGFNVALKTGRELVEAYLQSVYDEVHVIYSEFVSMARQVPVVKQLLPIPPIAPVEGETSRDKVIYLPEHICEPSADELLGEMLPRNVYVQLYSALLETSTSEHAARMMAMDNATKACDDMLERLTLAYNKARQAAITAELMDIVGGAEALKG
ncbi:MAG: ATP synthase F1 subunit gamma [Deltaproteobacteria bacterium]|nr:ATP synthase F1 subunit gamma [Deltaproteobacteria bacterium]MBW1994137.1 ATP synthase F1 subunit gamma [Deltaproteobacteria bacterium]MBW2153092.1 ATP synthase F1 subunit gamma [Deltaproteobacteria bacterium]